MIVVAVIGMILVGFAAQFIDGTLGMVMAYHRAHC